MTTPTDNLARALEDIAAELDRGAERGWNSVDTAIIRQASQALAAYRNVGREEQLWHSDGKEIRRQTFPGIPDGETARYELVAICGTPQRADEIVRKHNSALANAPAPSAGVTDV